jgi:hypothetical protein
MILKCELCNFDFNSTVHTPIALSCGHTFCIVCIEKIFKKNWLFKCIKCNHRYYNIDFPANEYVKIMRRKKLTLEKIFDISIDYKNDLSIVNEINITFSNGVYIEKINNENMNIKINKKTSNDKKKNILYEINPVKGIKSIKIEKKLSKREESTRTKTLSSNNSIHSTLSNYFPSKNNEYSSLFNYFELMKKIAIYNHRIKIKGKIFNYIYKNICFFLIIFLNCYIFHNFEFGIFFLFISILYENEYNFYYIVFKLKLYTAFTFYLLFEDMIYKVYYIINNIFWLNDVLIGIRTFYIILVLGNQITLDLIIIKIIKFLSYCNLLIKK